MDGWLFTFLLINVFLMGALAAVAIRHAYAHFRPHQEPKPKVPAPKVQLPPDVKKKLLDRAADNFQLELDRSAKELQQDLKSTVGQLNKQLEKLGTEIVQDEMKRYHASIDSLRHSANTTLSDAQSKMEAHRGELEAIMARRQSELQAKLQEEIEAEKQRLDSELDKKLGDAVAAFLVETLQHDVDLGAQNDYMLKMLEEHKDELKKGVTG